MKVFSLGLAIILFLLVSSSNASVWVDPTKPLDMYHTKGVLMNGEVYIISAIIVSKHKNLVIINGEKYSVNDLVNGYTITDIKENSVTLKDDAEEIKLKILDTVKIRQ